MAKFMYIVDGRCIKQRQNLIMKSFLSAGNNHDLVVQVIKFCKHFYFKLYYAEGKNYALL